MLTRRHVHVAAAALVVLTAGASSPAPLAAPDRVTAPSCTAAQGAGWGLGVLRLQDACLPALRELGSSWR